MKKQETKQKAAGILAVLVPVLILALMCLAAALLWQEHDPQPPQSETQTETQPQTEAVAETETQTEETEESGGRQQAQELLSLMTLEEKVAQLFMITPEALTGVEQVTAAGEATEEAYGQYPVGGIVYFEQNIASEEQLKEMLSNMKQISQSKSGVSAFLAVDEEGGSVARLANHESLDIENVGSMYQIGESKDAQKALEAGESIGGYLKEYGFDVDFAPVADVLDSGENTVIGDRSFGTDPNQVSEMTAKVTEGLQSQGVSAVLKHFPGHGSTAEDTHEGYAYSEKTLEELKAWDLLPFQAGIAAGADFVMVSHLSAPNAAGEDVPVVFSENLVTGVLREELGFEGIIITDALNMEAITGSNTSQEAAVRALQAGVDMLLMPEDFASAYQGVLDAVENGELTEERIDESVLRILTLKFQKQAES